MDVVQLICKLSDLHLYDLLILSNAYFYVVTQELIKKIQVNCSIECLFKNKHTPIANHTSDTYIHLRNKTYFSSVGWYDGK